MLQAIYWGMMKVALPVLPQLHKIFNVSEHQVHSVVSLSFILAGLSAVLWGAIIDRLKLKTFILSTVFLLILSLIITTLTNYFWIFALFYILSCLIATSYSVYSRSFPLLYFKNELLIKKSLSWRLIGGFSAAFLAPFIGGLISDHYGWHYTFIVIILWVLFIQIFVHFAIKDIPLLESHDSFISSIKQTLLHLKNRNFRRFLIILGCGNAISQSYIISIPFWLDKAYHIPIGNVAFYLFPLLFPGVVIPLISVHVMHRLEDKKIILFYFGLFILSGVLATCLGLIRLPLPAWIWVIPGVFANISMVGLGPRLAYYSLLNVTTNRNLASGLLSTFSYLFGGCGMYITLFIKLKTFYWEGGFIFSMACTMSIMLFLINKSKSSCGVS